MSSKGGGSVRLSSLDLAHVRFLDRLIERRAMTEDQGVALLSQELGRRPGSKDLLPISSGLLRTIASQVRRGCRRITIWTDEVGKRYVTADPPP
jgi:hypothetical protein